MLAYRTILIIWLQFCVLDGVAGQLLVRILVFSGRKNPSWMIAKSHAKYATISFQLGKALAANALSSPTQAPSRLGYQGIIVEPNFLLVGSKTAALQKLIFETMPPKALPEKVKLRVPGEIDALIMKPPPVQVVVQGKGGKGGKGTKEELERRGKRYAPPFNAAPFRGVDVATGVDHEEWNNCYNYANMKVTDTFAQPGRRSGFHLNRYYAGRHVQSAARSDGLFDHDTDRVCADSTRHVVALVVEDSVDFHWYVKNQDNTWSHKPGETAVTQLDNAGRRIRDPRGANMGTYRFVTFMTTNRNTIDIN